MKRPFYSQTGKGSLWAKSQALPSQRSSLGWERLRAGWGVRTGRRCFSSRVADRVIVSIFWEQGRTWALRQASGRCRPRPGGLASPWQPAAMRWACSLLCSLRGLPRPVKFKHSLPPLDDFFGLFLHFSIRSVPHGGEVATVSFSMP